MAAYASLLSLMHIIHQIENHPSPPISLHKQQVHSLTHVVTFLQEFLEEYVSPFSYSDEPDPLEVRIADAAYAAEDVIEPHIVDSIHLAAAAATQDSEETRSVDFFKSLQRVIEDMEFIMKEVAETVGEIKAVDEPQMHRGNNVASHGGVKSTKMVGFDDVLLQLLDRLTGRDLNRRIIPITGMGGIVFEEDQKIIVSKLIKLWVSEGFLKPKNGKSLETVAKEYVKELVERNLIMVDELGSLGKIKYCKIHDLLRDLSLKEAQKQRFCYVFKENNSPRDMSSQRRFVIPRTTPEEEVVGASESMSGARSFISCRSVERLPDFRLLRTLSTYDSLGYWHTSKYALEDVFGLVNSRYISVSTFAMSQVPSSVNLLWNLHTLLVVSRKELTAPNEIWQMHRLKHVVFNFGGVRLPDPPSSENGNDIVVLENLQTLKRVKNLDLSEEVARRIPNIKKLKINYEWEMIERVKSLSYLCCLSRLESLEYITEIGGSDKFLEEISFPRSLKKLKIWAGDDIELEKILAKIGSLPLLHTLFFSGGFFRTREWEIVEGQFPSLRSLTLWRAPLNRELDKCGELEKWTMPEDSSTCFPLLEQLNLTDFERLEGIPPEFGEIPTLELIILTNCSESAVVSAKRIVEEQEDLHGEEQGLHVQVKCRTEEEAQALQYLATPNFHVSRW